MDIEDTVSLSWFLENTMDIIVIDIRTEIGTPTSGSPQNMYEP
jgi:hypothetical protein